MKHFLFILAAAALLSLLSCGRQDDPVNPDRLCGDDVGVGMRVDGRAEPLQVCVSDEDAVTNLNQSTGRFEIVARMTTTDAIFEFQMIFAHHPNFPVSLNLTANLAQATSDPDGVWLLYQEIPTTGTALTTSAITAGTFTLSISATDVVTGTLSGVQLMMEERDNMQAAGTREILEGFFSLLVESS